MVRSGQIKMNLKPPDVAEDHFGSLDQRQLQEAYLLTQDPQWMMTIGRMLQGPGASGVSTEMVELYNYALAIQAKRFRKGKNGWEVVT